MGPFKSDHINRDHIERLFLLMSSFWWRKTCTLLSKPTYSFNQDFIFLFDQLISSMAFVHVLWNKTCSVWIVKMLKSVISLYRNFDNRKTVKTNKKYFRTKRKPFSSITKLTHRLARKFWPDFNRPSLKKRPWSLSPSVPTMTHSRRGAAGRSCKQCGEKNNQLTKDSFK